MSDTPRTDAFTDNAMKNMSVSGHIIALTEFASTLERELAAIKINAEGQEQGSGATSPRADKPFAPAPSAPPSASQPDTVAAPCEWQLSDDAEKAMPEEPEYLIRLRNALKGFKSDGAFAGDKDIVAYIDALRAYAVQKESENNRRLALLKEAHDKMFSCTVSCGNEIFDKIGYELVREFDK